MKKKSQTVDFAKKDMYFPYRLSKTLSSRKFKRSYSLVVKMGQWTR